MEAEKKFYQYNILQTLEGTNTLLAEHSQLNRRVLIQKLNTDYTEPERLAKIMALQHPSIPIIYDYIENAHGKFWITEEIMGEHLDQFLSKNTLSELQKEKLFLQIVQAVGYLHHQGLVHSQIKPQYIRVTQNLECKLTGLLPYFNEQKEVDNREDIASLGNLLLVFYSAHSLPEYIKKCIQKATHSKVIKRYHTCEDFKEDFIAQKLQHEAEILARNQRKNNRMAFLWGGLSVFVTISLLFIIKNFARSSSSKSASGSEVQLQLQKPINITEDTIDYTKLAEEKSKAIEADSVEEEKTPEEIREDSIRKVEEEERKRKETIRKQYKEQLSKKIIVDGQFVSSQAGEYKVLVEVFNNNEEDLLDVEIEVVYFNASGEEIGRQEASLGSFPKKEVKSLEVIKKIKAARFSIKLSDIRFHDPIEIKEDSTQNPQDN